MEALMGSGPARHREWSGMAIIPPRNPPAPWSPRPEEVTKNPPDSQHVLFVGERRAEPQQL